MAKKKGKKYDQSKWQPQATDAIKLAAVRWFACVIEAEAIQIYATDASKFAGIEKVMKACVEQMHGLKKTFGEAGEGDCPPGFVPCGKECAPMCLEN